MTKSWDLHEATIKRLYAENTLAAVRVIMIDKYNFKASTRAYRGRLIKWGVRKYNRRRSDCGSSSCGSLDGSIGSSDFAFINSHREAGPTGYDLARYSITRHNGDSEQMPSTMSSSAASTDIGSPLSSEESRSLITPTHTMPYEWGSSAHHVPLAADFSHHGTAGGSECYYDYGALSPASSTYPGATYESDQMDCYRSSDYLMWPSGSVYSNANAVSV